MRFCGKLWSFIRLFTGTSRNTSGGRFCRGFPLKSRNFSLLSMKKILCTSSPIELSAKLRRFNSCKKNAGNVSLSNFAAGKNGYKGHSPLNCRKLSWLYWWFCFLTNSIRVDCFVPESPFVQLMKYYFERNLNKQKIIIIYSVTNQLLLSINGIECWNLPKILRYCRPHKDSAPMAGTLDSVMRITSNFRYFLNDMPIVMVLCDSWMIITWTSGSIFSYGNRFRPTKISKRNHNHLII